MKQLLSHFVSVFLSLTIFSTCVFAQNVDRSRLQQSRERQQKELSAMKATQLKENKKLLNNLLICSGSLAGSLLLFSIFQKAHERKVPKVNYNKLTSVDLYAMQSKISSNMRQGALYSAAELGPEGIALLKEEFERWKVAHVYEWKRVHSVSVHKAYRVKEGMERAFQDEVAQLYQKYLSRIQIDEKLMLKAGEKGLGNYPMVWKQEFERIVLEGMKKGGILKKYVAEANGKSYVSSMLKAAGREGIIGRVGLLSFAKKSLPFVVIGLALGANNAQAQEKEMLRRAYENPSLLVGLSDQDFEKIASSSEMADFYLEVCDTFSKLVNMSSEEKAALKEATKQDMHAQQQMWREKFVEQMKGSSY